MITILSVLVSLLSFRLRSRASLELELTALRHQVAVLRRQRSGRLRLFSTDRLLWVWLYRIWPQALHAIVPVKPATVIESQWLPALVPPGLTSDARGGAFGLGLSRVTEIELGAVIGAKIVGN